MQRFIHQKQETNKFREKHQYWLKLGTGQNILLNNYYDVFLKNNNNNNYYDIFLKFFLFIQSRKWQKDVK